MRLHIVLDSTSFMSSVLTFTPLCQPMSLPVIANVYHFVELNSLEASTDFRTFITTWYKAWLFVIWITFQVWARFIHSSKFVDIWWLISVMTDSTRFSYNVTEICRDANIKHFGNKIESEGDSFQYCFIFSITILD